MNQKQMQEIEILEAKIKEERLILKSDVTRDEKSEARDAIAYLNLKIERIKAGHPK